MIYKSPTCQVCRKEPAVKQVFTSSGQKMWRCQICADLKNRNEPPKGK